ncbi:hypothetical protein DVH24_039049 [Malus domestica]|uniref:Uncharacterized protein n=1 Tax=Malus domestica TaxID=3750 RepID=A0A498KG87_MALDO|nr:hypothetical protein DVH24_039049 [Malus domestica]
MQEGTIIEEPLGEDYSLMEEIVNLVIPPKPVDPNISPELIPTQTYMPHIQYPEAARQPTKLHECIGTDMFEWVIHINLEADPTHNQHLTHLPDLDTGQTAQDKTIFAAVTDSEPTKPIIIVEIEGMSIEKAKTYKEKKTFCGNQISHRQIRPMQKIWVAFGTDLT